jgi:hypothetical protein
MDWIRDRNERADGRVVTGSGGDLTPRAAARPTVASTKERSNTRKETPMAMSMSSLLIHSHAVSSDVRAALEAAEHAPVEIRAVARKDAARLLVRESTIDCRDARELVDLAPGSC